MSSHNNIQGEPVLVSIKRASELTSFSRTMINRLRASHQFPQAVPLGDRRIAFFKSEVTDWIAQRIAVRGANDNAKKSEVAA